MRREINLAPPARESPGRAERVPRVVRVVLVAHEKQGLF